MQLEGKYIGMWMRSAAVAAVLGWFEPDDKSTDPKLLVAGEVIGETPGVGLWVTIDTIADEDGKPSFSSIAKRPPTRLVRWVFIENAELFDTKPSVAEIGFRAH